MSQLNRKLYAHTDRDSRQYTIHLVTPNPIPFVIRKLEQIKNIYGLMIGFVINPADKIMFVIDC